MTTIGIGTDGATVVLERCVLGRLRLAYPVNGRDVEVLVFGALEPDVLTDTLATVASAIWAADHRCRRVVYGAPTGDIRAMRAAEAAGFRFVIEVDLPGIELTLFVSEPDWVIRDDIE